MSTLLLQQLFDVGVGQTEHFRVARSSADTLRKVLSWRPRFASLKRLFCRRQEATPSSIGGRTAIAFSMWSNSTARALQAECRLLRVRSSLKSGSNAGVLGQVFADRVNIYLWIISSLDIGSSSIAEADFDPALA